MLIVRFYIQRIDELNLTKITAEFDSKHNLEEIMELVLILTEIADCLQGTLASSRYNATFRPLKLTATATYISFIVHFQNQMMTESFEKIIEEII